MKPIHRCPNCNKLWSVHLGHKDTCERLQSALRAITTIKSMAAWNDLSSNKVIEICESVLNLPMVNVEKVKRQMERRAKENPEKQLTVTVE